MKSYDLELERAVNDIKEAKAKLVCIQLPDGLKPQAREIQQHLEKNTDAKIVIWMGSCWGGCDVPVNVKDMGADLLIQWGHSVYIRSW
ncbi:diphthamide synthesis protein [Candidatus Woesearchaeota archaeon]|nr:diphthamide synthesis protein [Candidatus Woesearchaeota archaeon]